MTLSQLQDVLRKRVDGNKEALVRMSRFIWENPEIGYQEKKASALLSGELERGGFQVERGIVGLETAFMAEHNSGKPGPSVALVAEYDALPELDHACGHNLFSVSAVGAALALRDSMAELGGVLYVIGTPAEEGVVPNAGSKHILVKHGIFNGIDAAFICHAEDRTIVERSLHARMTLEMTFQGKPAHAGGAPWEGVNALNAAQLTLHGIDCLRQHVVPTVRLHAIVKEGGALLNTVPERAVLGVEVKAPNSGLVDETAERVRNCARGGALATGCTVEMEIKRITYSVKPNHALGLAFGRSLEILGVPYEQAGAAGYGWDMGLVTHTVPSIDPYIKIGPEGIVGHTPEFNEAAGSPSGMEGMLIAASAMAMTVAEFLTSKELQEETRREFLASPTDVPIEE